MRKLARDGIASKKSITPAMLGLFQETMALHRLFIPIALYQIVSFMPIAPSWIVS